MVLEYRSLGGILPSAWVGGGHTPSYCDGRVYANLLRIPNSLHITCCACGDTERAMVYHKSGCRYHFRGCLDFGRVSRSHFQLVQYQSNERARHILLLPLHIPRHRSLLVFLNPLLGDLIPHDVVFQAPSRQRRLRVQGTNRTIEASIAPTTQLQNLLSDP